jgi:tetratricopeptide (TPR) repeat protein
MIELGAYPAAVTALEEALATAEQLGLRDLTAGVKHNLGLALARSGRLEEGRVMELGALKTAVAQRNRRLECGCRTYLALILLLMGDPPSAEREARAALDIVSVAPPMRAHAMAVVGYALLHQGRAEAAHAMIDDAVRLVRSLGGLEEGESLLARAHVETLLALGEAEAAREALRAAHERLSSRAELIEDPVWRESFLHAVADNARVLELCAEVEAAG